MNMIMDKMYTIAIVGAAGVGKTTYLNRLAGREFSAPWRPTGAREDRTLAFNTNYGPISIKFNDYSGAGTYDGRWIDTGVDGVLYMYDITNRTTWRSINTVYSKLFAECPSVTLANKVDVDPHEYKVHSTPGIEEISTKRSINLLNPIQSLLKRISGHEDINIV